MLASTLTRTARAAASGLAAALALPTLASAGVEETRLRDLTTDRPDTSESPFTIDAGHLQLETTLFGFGRSRRDPSGVRSDAYEVATTNLRLGLTPRLEADIVLQPYGRVRTSATSGGGQGVGDLTLRAKLNLWGPDGPARPGAGAAALLPFIDIPLDRSSPVGGGAVGGGLIVPYDVRLPGPYELSLNTGVHVVREDLARGYEAQVLLSASLGRDWTDRIGAYYEIAAEVNRGDPRGQVVYANTGATWKVRDNLQLDAGVNIGLSRAADRYALFVGASARF